MYVKLIDNVPSDWPVTFARVKHDNPNVSFPSSTSTVDVSSYGFAPYEYADPEEYDPEYQNCVEVTPVLSGDNYVQTWQITDKYTSDERTAYDAQKEADRIDGLPDIHRATRDILIAETDFYALSDVTMFSAMTAYRQALRDITAHANWPNLDEADWPTAP
jgi:hypothetical protein